LPTRTERSVVRMLVETLGIGVALACMFWVLGHLTAFHFFGYILVGEENRLILFSEIALISSGFLCFLADFWLRKTSNL
jgi:hypothetical protein